MKTAPDVNPPACRASDRLGGNPDRAADVRGVWLPVRFTVPRRIMRVFSWAVLRPVLALRLSAPWQRALIEMVTRVAVVPQGLFVESVAIGGVPAERLTPPSRHTPRTLLYLHGGGYRFGSPATHRALAAHLANGIGAVAYVLDYRLAPENRYPAAVDDAVAAYQAIIDGGIAPHHIVVAGDSAGGGLAIALALRARNVGLPQPAALALMSPWVDLRPSGYNPSIPDPLLTPALVTTCARGYAPTDLEADEVSPVVADLEGLAPVLVHAGSDEIFRDSIEAFVARATAAGNRAMYRRLDGHWHVTHLFAGLLREGTEAVAEMSGWVRAELATDGSDTNPGRAEEASPRSTKSASIRGRDH